MEEGAKRKERGRKSEGEGASRNERGGRSDEKEAARRRKELPPISVRGHLGLVSVQLPFLNGC